MHPKQKEIVLVTNGAVSISYKWEIQNNMKRQRNFKTQKCCKGALLILSANSKHTETWHPHLCLGDTLNVWNVLPSTVLQLWGWRSPSPATHEHQTVDGEIKIQTQWWWILRLWLSSVSVMLCPTFITKMPDLITVFWESIALVTQVADIVGLQFCYLDFTLEYFLFYCILIVHSFIYFCSAFLYFCHCRSCRSCRINKLFAYQILMIIFPSCF